MSRAAKWVAIIGLGVGLGVVSCASTATSDDGIPDGVRVQRYTDSDRSCLVFTHDDTMGMGGVSIAVDCVAVARQQTFREHE